MKVSIITVVYNQVETLSRTIMSVANQSSKDIEYIIIDGGSTDGTLEIIHKNKKHIDMWSSEPDTGIYNAMNKGAEKATGDYLYFLNADDWLANIKIIENVVTLLEKNKVALLYGYIILLYPNYQVSLSRQFSHQVLSKGMIPPHQASFIQRKTFWDLNGYDESYKAAGDLDFYCRLKIKDAEFLKVDTEIAYMSTGGLSSEKKLIYNEVQSIIQRYYGKYKALLFRITKIYLEQGSKKLLKTLRLHALYEKLAQWNNNLSF